MIRIRFAVVAVTVVTGLLSAPLLGQEPAESARRARDDVDAAVRTDQDAQQSVETWANERAALQVRHRNLEHSVGVLERRLSRERNTVTALEAKVAEYERRLIESARLTVSLEDTLSVLVERLNDAVASDLPFLPSEREARLTSLEVELGNPDASAAEKLRRVLEAYQVEAGYGGTVELVTDRIELDGREVRVDVLRLGRLALFWSTPDRERLGMWDVGAGAWTELDRGRHRAVLQAMDMAARIRPVEVIGLPLGRIAP